MRKKQHIHPHRLPPKAAQTTLNTQNAAQFESNSTNPVQAPAAYPGTPKRSEKMKIINEVRAQSKDEKDSDTEFERLMKTLHEEVEIIIRKHKEKAKKHSKHGNWNVFQ